MSALPGVAMWPLSSSGKSVLAVGAETSATGGRMTFPPPERKYCWGEHVVLKRGKCTREENTIWNKCKGRHEQKLEKLTSEVNEMSAAR